VLKEYPFGYPTTRLKVSRWPCVPAWRQGSVLIAALVRPPGIIVAMTLVCYCLRRKGTLAGGFTHRRDSHLVQDRGYRLRRTPFLAFT